MVTSAGLVHLAISIAPRAVDQWLLPPHMYVTMGSACPGWEGEGSACPGWEGEG